MVATTATEFAKRFGRYKEEAQREPVAITSHGRISGYFVSAHEYDVNVVTWPGYDLRQIPGQAGHYDYGLLPPRFFESIVRRFAELRKSGQITATCRDDEA